MNAVDTNIFNYSVDQNEPVKQIKAQQLLQQLHSATEPTVMLWQVLGELVQQFRRWENLNKMTHAEFMQRVHSFRHLFPLVLPTVEVLDHALELSERHSLSHWDSMILGACQAVGITTLHTEDMGAPRIIEGIKLSNPF